MINKTIKQLLDIAQILQNNLTNAPYPPHWTLNSYFDMIHTVWMHWGLFCCLAKLGAKRGEMVQLMQKFVPRSRVGIFDN